MPLEGLVRDVATEPEAASPGPIHRRDRIDFQVGSRKRPALVKPIVGQKAEAARDERRVFRGEHTDDRDLRRSIEREVDDAVSEVVRARGDAVEVGVQENALAGRYVHDP